VVARVAVTVRTASFYTRTKITKLAAPSTEIVDIERAALRVLDRFTITRPVRLLGVRLELEPLD
jgi:DNA polymerase-4